jgi:hypothetical protein
MYIRYLKNKIYERKARFTINSTDGARCKRDIHRSICRLVHEYSALNHLQFVYCLAARRGFSNITNTS